MVVREIDVGRDPISLESVHTGTVPILESCVNAGTFHVHEDKPTGVWIP